MLSSVFLFLFFVFLGERGVLSPDSLCLPDLSMVPQQSITCIFLIIFLYTSTQIISSLQKFDPSTSNYHPRLRFLCPCSFASKPEHLWS